MQGAIVAFPWGVVQGKIETLGRYLAKTNEKLPKIELNVKKRFIAGAVCPKCKAMDTMWGSLSEMQGNGHHGANQRKWCRDSNLC